MALVQREHRKVLDFIHDLFKESKEAHKEAHKQMQEHERVYHKGHRAEEAKENRIFSIIEQELAIMTDARPQINISAAKKQQDKVAPILNKVANAIARRINLDEVRDDLLWYQKVLGTGFLKLFWEGDETGNGDLCVTAPDPKQMYVDPDAKSLKDCKYILWAGHIPLVDLRGKYKNAKEVEPGDTWGIDYAPGKKGTVKSPAREEKRIEKKCYPTAGVVECFFTDDERIRRIATVANGVLLKPNRREPVAEIPYKHKKFPYVRVTNYRSGGFWGASEVTILLNLQAELNKRQEQISENLDWLIEGIWLAVGNVGLDDEVIRSLKRGDIARIPSGSELRKIFGSSLPSDAWNSVLDLKRAMEDTSGLNEVSFGRSSSEIKSGYMLDLLQEASIVRLRRTGRNLEYAFKDFGEQLISNIKQFYDTTETYRWAGEYFDFSSEKMDEASQYEFEIDFVSSLPISKAILRNMAIQLYQLGVIDRKAIVDTFERPAWNEALERIEKKEAEAVAVAKKVDQLRGGNGGEERKASQGFGRIF